MTRFSRQTAVSAPTTISGILISVALASTLLVAGNANTGVTFFFRKKQLDRIEKRRRAPFAQCQVALTR